MPINLKRPKIVWYKEKKIMNTILANKTALRQFRRITPNIVEKIVIDRPVQILTEREQWQFYCFLQKVTVKLSCFKALLLGCVSALCKS